MNDLFAAVAQTSAVQSVQRRLEEGGALACAGVSPAAQPFVAALLRRSFPRRPIVVVTEGLKTQESFHQDIATWLFVANGGSTGNDDRPRSNSQPSTFYPQPLFYPAWEMLPHEARLPHADVISERLETLTALTNPASGTEITSPLIVANVLALLQRSFPPRELSRRTRLLERGARHDPLDLVEWLEEQGYEPEAQVTQKGEIALRGGILDVYPPTSPWPVRLEFFGDELESLRCFDPLTQISREEITSVTLPPAGELGLLKRARSSPVVHGGSSGVEADRTGQRPGEESSVLGTMLDYLPSETIFVLCEPEALASHADQYAGQIPADDQFYIAWGDLKEQMTASGMTVVELCEAAPDSPSPVGPAEEVSKDFDGKSTGGHDPVGHSSSSLHEPGPLTPSLSPNGGEGVRRTGEGDSNWFMDPMRDSEIVEAAHDPHPLPPSLSPTGGEGGRRPGERDKSSGRSLLSFTTLDTYRPLGDRAPEPQIAEAQRREFFAQLHRWLRQGYAVHVFCNNDGERQRFTEIWKEYGLATGETQGIDCRVGSLARGFLCDEAKAVVVTDAEIFGRYKVQRPRRLKSPHATAARSALDINFTELEEGDYVVHIQHGIGRYLGLKMLPLGTRNAGAETRDPNLGQECLVIEYAAGDPDQPPPKLYVPVTEAHLVSKYVGAGKARPPLNTLGGTRWAKVKAQAEKAVRDLAGELLSIQAARESQPGHAFSPDAPWQREFEGSFIYEETVDQVKAIADTKSDLEKAKPMDRLICGDVGFGKTEVAIRAAFKAVMGGKQVAVLVPTTVLAQQHFNTFRERMADYPVRIELLSRFRTRRQQDRVIKDLAAGAVDIVIGTHRLVQEDIAFKDLGLVVIDEEQRFGVMQKEKFKRLRKLVDVLTLSATPIPRTLYLALTGARDMSTIETPPQDRLPVETIVTQYDERTIRDAIQRELNRGGQVFFLHNRVITIETVAKRLQTLVPDARIVVGHGQLHADDLEEVMTQFVNGEADVLLSTTIIESGLDIPNANTIIIDRADRFGLSDLYQLRGRVGRYKHQAYAYLLLPRHAGLLSDARKRISAIKQYSTLGSGFKIAMRDLEIRGAGNLLGSEQSGHITAVGFELYCQLLKQSVSSLKGEKVKPRVEVQVRLDFLALNTGEEPSVASDRSSVISGRSSGGDATDHERRTTNRASAYIPLRYISDPRQRIDIYRKLAQATDKRGLEALRAELKDRFGPSPPAMELLLQVVELKVLAGDRGIPAIETKEDKLMLVRNNDYITLAGKFPRLTKVEPKARLNEIKKLLLAL